MFIFRRSIAGPLVALAVSLVLVALDALFTVGLFGAPPDVIIDWIVSH